MESQNQRKGFVKGAFTRIILGIFIIFLTFILIQKFSVKILEITTLDKNYRNLIKGIVASSSVLLVYYYFHQWYEKRKITELSTNNFGKNLFLGIAIGFVLLCLTVLVIALFGVFMILSVNSWSTMIIPFTVALSVAIFEEILMRGIIFRISEEKLGSVIALAISSIVFALLHIANPNGTVLSGLCVLVAGFLFGLAYIYKRNLWLPIAIHFSWNFMQSGIFGAVTSGNEKTSSLLTTEISGNNLITGGLFGPEGSIQAVIFCLIASLLLYQMSKNNLIRPSWQK
ncbi:MAG: CPBP family intramembrane metalloprotease [Saprospiraceae bacterium]|nr:CPBP family intramembrane metalloprotease [Saprospiraceae bacterium]